MIIIFVFYIIVFWTIYLNQTQSFSLLYVFSRNLNINFFNYFYITIFFFYFLINKLKLFKFFIFFFSFIVIKLKKKIITFGLLIGYNSIHPYLFYYSFLNTIFYYLTLNSVYLNKKIIYYMSILALILGGYWGFGSSVWGYFWVNDSIEWNLLTIVFLNVLSFHVYYNLRFKMLYASVCLLILYNIILFRFGFFFTRHSFFDLTKLKNTFFLYSCLLYFFNWIFYLGCFLFLKCFSIFIIVILIKKSWKKIVVSNFYNILFHLFILALTFNWLKHRNMSEILINYFFLKKLLYSINFYFNFYSSYFFIVISSHKKLFFFLKKYTIISFKATKKKFIVFAVYSFALWLFLFIK